MWQAEKVVHPRPRSRLGWAKATTGRDHIMPKFVVSSYERAAHQALFGFRGKPANLVVSVVDPDSDLPTDLWKAPPGLVGISSGIFV